MSIRAAIDAANSAACRAKEAQEERENRLFPGDYFLMDPEDPSLPVVDLEAEIVASFHPQGLYRGVCKLGYFD